MLNQWGFRQVKQALQHRAEQGRVKHTQGPVRFLPEQLRSIWLLLAPSVGDVVINVPLAQALKYQFLHSRLTVVWGRGVDCLKTLMPWIDETLCLDSDWFNNEKRRGEPWDSLNYWRDPQRRTLLDRKPPDLLVNANGLLESLWLAYQIQAPFRIGTHIPCDAALPAWTGWSAPAPGVHISDHNMAWLRALGASVASPALPDLASFADRLPDTQALRQRVRAQRPEHDQAPLVMFNPFAAQSSPSKRWHPDQELEFARTCAAKGWQVVLVGSPADRPLAAHWGQNPNVGVCNLIGQFSLLELAALMRQADVYVGLDTGTTHLSAALHCPTVTLFGRLDVNYIAPRGPRVRVLKQSNACTLSQKGCCTRLQCEHRVCMQAIHPLQVVEACAAWIR